MMCQGDLLFQTRDFTRKIFLPLLSIILRHLPKTLSRTLKIRMTFLSKLASLPPLPDNVILCPIDVVGLYPNIPHAEGLIAMLKALDLRKDKRISTESLIELAECVLKNNSFQHDLSFYKQLRGTAIDTKMAPPYVIIFLGDLEERFFRDCDISPVVWWRYIDDIFICCGNIVKKYLKKFLEILNYYHLTIKFTANYSREKTSFLDIEEIKKGNQLVTDLYIKPTDTHHYLHASSCHVFHSKKSIPYSQALKLNRICSENSFFDKRFNDLDIWLKGRGYSNKLVRKQILKARKFQERNYSIIKKKQRK